MDKKDNGRSKFMAKPIEATPILRGEDLVKFAESLQKQDSPVSKEKRQSALSMLRKATK